VLKDNKNCTHFKGSVHESVQRAGPALTPRPISASVLGNVESIELFQQRQDRRVFGPRMPVSEMRWPVSKHLRNASGARQRTERGFPGSAPHSRTNSVIRSISMKPNTC
jgi:hypothetical protein